VERKVASRSIPADDWNAVWADYDRRKPAAAPVLVERRQRAAQGPLPVGQRNRRGRGWLIALLMAPLIGGAANWLSAPVATAWQVAQAMETRDAGAMAPHLDQMAVQGAARVALAEAARGPGGAQATAFLAGMANDMAGAWSSPNALAEVARARGVTHGAAAEAMRNARPQGLTRIDLPLGQAATPITLRLELRDGVLSPRWQVTEVRMEAAR